MTTTQIGILIVRLLAIYLAASGVRWFAWMLTGPSVLNALAGIGLFLVAAAFLWIRAGWLAERLIPAPSEDDRPVTSRGLAGLLLAVGIAIVGLYLLAIGLFSVAGGAILLITEMFRETPTGTPGSVIVSSAFRSRAISNLGGGALYLVVGILALLRNQRLSEWVCPGFPPP